MKDSTQLDYIREKMLEQGYINNLQAFKNYILRLGMHIHILRKEKDITGCYGSHITNLSQRMREKHKKIFYYFDTSNIVSEVNGEYTLKKFK